MSADVPCDDVRGCLSAGDGITFNQATGEIAAHLSGTGGNNLQIGPDGGLHVPTAGGQILTGCGLTGNGSASSPVKANTATWPYQCAVGTYGGNVYCDSQGRLRTEPRGAIVFPSYFEERNYADLTVPSARNTVLDSFTVNVTNPDPCRPAFLMTERELDVYVVLPPGAGAGTGQGSDEMFYSRNSGTTTVESHSQSTKFLAESAPIPPGATVPVTLNASAGRGTGGAYYNLISFTLRTMLIIL
ncbi:hypothetical protein OG234_13105 [Streptomyces sp. NBC_01420]|uniref:hypothetical protein n=1 Tax=Streptomyces sp. NBC_01420 TaxID=2903858 RepID=UPI0032544E03